MRGSRHVVLCAIGWWFCVPAAHALEAREIFKLADPSIVVVLASDAKGEKGSLGSGVIIAPLDILTSCKVVESASDIVVTQGNALRKARLRFQDGERDLCQLRIEEPLPTGKPVAVRVSKELEVGQDVFLIASPRGLERTISRGMISGLREMAGTAGRLIQTDTATGGSIGGGLFDQEARFVGLVTQQSKLGDGASYAAPADWVAELAQRSPDHLLATTSALTASEAVASRQDAKRAQRPEWMPKLGDRWTYQLLHERRKSGQVTIEIVEAGDNIVTERITYDRSKGFFAERQVEVGFNTVRFQPLKLLPGGYQLAELAPYVAPDSQPNSGQRWSNIAAEYSVYGTGRRNLLTTARAVGQEKVHVPAGEFDAWKIQTASESTRYGGGPISIKCTFWYSPAMKRAVKINVFTDSTISVVSTNETYELVSFEGAK